VATTGLQRYSIMAPLGAGSQGHTYRAIDRDTGDEVAIKVLSLGGAREWKPFELFEREVEVLAGLRHPGIPRYRDSFASEASGDYFLVMDLVEGRTLAAELAKPDPFDRATSSTGFDEARLRHVAAGILDILAYLHSRTPPIIHRDIKPANVIVDGSDRVHLVDFGGVRVAARPDGGSTMIGTLGYMAPEQLHGDASPAVDLYALGATLVALATGRPPDELPHVGLTLDLDPLELPASLRPLLGRLLEPDPRARLRTVAEARALLDGGGKTPRDTSRQTAPPSQALAIPAAVQDLAETRQPFAIAVWMVSLMAAAGLVVIEYAILPLVYLILRAVADNKLKQGKPAADDEANIASLREFRRSTTHKRELVTHVIRGTSPLRDDGA
jgi:serine/threonine protein kinase